MLKTRDDWWRKRKRKYRKEVMQNPRDSLKINSLGNKAGILSLILLPLFPVSKIMITQRNTKSYLLLVNRTHLRVD